MWMKRLAVVNQVIIRLGCVTQLLAGWRSDPLSRRRVVESLLSWSLPLNLGVLETFYFVRHVRHVLRSGVGQSAEGRMWLREAVAHFAFGVLGMLYIRFRGMFWFATIIGQAILFMGIAALSGREKFKDKMSLFDVLMSLAHLCLLKAYDALEVAWPRPVWRRWFGA